MGRSRKTKQPLIPAGESKVKKGAVAEKAQMKEMAKRPDSGSKITKGSRRRVP